VSSGRGRQQGPQGGYEDAYNAFSYQLPSYNNQANYNMPPWAAHGQQMFLQPGAYPTATASGSPMNYNGYYPPTTYGASPAYGASSSGGAYRGGYSSAGAPAYSNTPNFGTSGGYGNGYTATSGASYNPAFDPALMTGMQNMSFGK
jgi:hypothetical protein